jgi:hypothetical protein
MTVVSCCYKPTYDGFFVASTPFSITSPQSWLLTNLTCERPKS